MIGGADGSESEVLFVPARFGLRLGLVGILRGLAAFLQYM